MVFSTSSQTPYTPFEPGSPNVPPTDIHYKRAVSLSLSLSRLLNPSGWNNASSWRTSPTVALLMILITGVYKYC